MNIKEADEYLRALLIDSKGSDELKAFGWVYAKEALQTLLDSKKNNSCDVTNEYIDMLDAFSCDFSKDKLQDNLNCYGDVQFTFPVSERLVNDIETLQKLAFDLRHNKLKIIDTTK